MSDDYVDSMISGYDEAEESAGFSGDPLPTGWYPMVVEKVLETRTTKNGTPQVRLQLQVKEGDKKEERSFVTVNCGAALVSSDGSQRSKEEIKDAGVSIQGQMKGLLKALGVTTGQPVGNGNEKIFSFYNVGSWAGREFMAKINYQPPRGQYAARNNLNAFYHFSDERHGLKSWQAKNAGGSGAAAASEAQTI